jgi:hypothetical protein
MTASALEHETPLLSILAVRDQLAPFSDLAPFEHDVEAAIRRSARTGSLDDLAQTLRTWLGIALQARWAAEGRLVRDPLSVALVKRILCYRQEEEPRATSLQSRSVRRG